MTRPGVGLPLDQMLFAAANFLPLLALGSVMEASDFGLVAVFFTAISGTALLARSWTGIPALLEPQDQESPAVALSLIAGLVFAVVGVIAVLILAAPSPGAYASVALMAGTPFFFAHDASRHTLMGTGDVRELLQLGLIWLAVESSLLIAALLIAEIRFPAMSIAWTAGAVAAFAFRRPQVTLKRLSQWRAAVGATARPQFADAVLNTLRQQGHVFLLAVVSGLAITGSYRLAIGVFGPATMAVLGWRNHSIVALKSGSISALSKARLWAIPMAIGLTVMIAVVLVPDSLAREISGNTEADGLFRALGFMVFLAPTDSFSQATLIASDRSNVVAKVRVLTAAFWLIPLVVWGPETTAELSYLLILSASLSSALWMLAAFIGRASFVSADVAVPRPSETRSMNRV